MTNEATLLDSLPISEHWKQLLSNPIFKLGMIVGSEYASEWYDTELERVETECNNDCSEAYKLGYSEGQKDYPKGITMIDMTANSTQEEVSLSDILLAGTTPSHPIIASVFLSTSF